jgi:hypothetical protein
MTEDVKGLMNEALLVEETKAKVLKEICLEQGKVLSQREIT